jgi:hypothetical protein
MGGRAVHLDFIPPDGGDRTQIRAEVRAIDNPNLKNSALLATVEILDNATGQATIVCGPSPHM